MATIRENILANLKTVLSTISIANGYDNNIASVQRYLMHGNPLVNVPAIIITAGPERKAPNPNPLQTCHMTVFLEIWVTQAQSDTTPTDTVINSIYGDIEKAVMVDVTRGGNAIDNLVVGAVPFETIEGQPYAGLIIELDVEYQHNQNDPESYP
jgi:hypothetical protein